MEPEALEGKDGSKQAFESSEAQKTSLNLSFPNSIEAPKTLFSLFEPHVSKIRILRSHFNVAIIDYSKKKLRGPKKIPKPQFSQ